MIAYNAWNLLTSQICEIEVPDFVSICCWYGYIYTYNCSTKKMHTDGAILCSSKLGTHLFS